MEQNTQENKKNLASRLAHLIMSGNKDEKQINALKQELGLLTPLSRDPAPQTASPGSQAGNIDDQGIVGVWKPDLVKGQTFYVRDPRLANEYLKWAKIHRIPPKTSRPRICFLGESVARGFLYDPHYTPAGVLEKILNLNPEVLKAEVIDLARTDCTMAELIKVTSSCLALQPDALVIFAGNNWHLDLRLTETDFKKMIDTLENEQGFKAFKNIIEEKYVTMVAQFMEFVSTLSQQHNIPVVIIIPEFNLLDWHSNMIERRLLFPGKGLRQWFQLKKEAEQLLKAGNLEKAEQLCQEMIEMNETNPRGYELLAQCKLEKNLYKEAVKYFRLAHDTRMFQVVHNPGILEVVQHTLLKLARHYQLPYIDLPAVFNCYEEGIVPGRELFVDYCHLSARGIRLAMTHTAKCLLSLFTGKDIQPDENEIAKIEPGKEVASKTHFLAAIHSAHWGQSYEIVHYHCLKALQSAKSVEKLMSHYVRMASKHVPWIISKDFEEIAKTGVLSHYYITQPEGEEIMDILLVDAMTEALRSVGINIQENIKQLRIKEHSFNNGKINLLESYYHLTYIFKDPHYRKHYYQAFDVQSDFYLVTGKAPRISFDLTCRIPVKNQEEQYLELSVNHQIISKLPVSDKWKTHSIPIPRESLNDHINTITLQWPVMDNWPQPTRNENESPDNFLWRKMKPIFGEIHSFRAYKEE